MKREHDPILDRVRQQVPPSPGAFERLERRRDAKATRSRVVAGVVGLAIAGALVGGLVVWGPLADRSSRVGTEPVSPVPLVAGDGQYYYVSTANYEHPTGVLDNGQTQPLAPLAVTGGAQWWVGTDDSGRIKSIGGPTPNDGRWGPGEFPGELVPSLSTDPDVLRSQLIDRGSRGGASPGPIASSSPGGDQEATSIMWSLDGLLGLRGPSFLTPEQGRAAFEVLQGVHGVTTEPGLITDPLGRPAVQLSFAVNEAPGAPGTREDWFFEPTTGQFMGLVQVDGSGVVEYAILIREAGISDSLNGPPLPDALYVPEGVGDATFTSGAGSS